MYEVDIKNQKIEIVNMTYKNKIATHISPAFAVLEIFNVLLRDIMNIKDGIDGDGSDKLVLSNGHVALGLYAVYETMGIITLDEFYTYKMRDSKLGAHQDRHHTPGTIISTGSLGHGLPNAVGVAYAWKYQNKPNRMFVTVGDGELNEGTIWESIIFAARMKLNNICLIIDDNNSTDYMPNIAGKLRAFDWETVVVDGHDENSLREVLFKVPRDNPYAVIAKTVKGKGVSFIEENHAKWHEKMINDDEYALIMEALK